MPVIGLLMAIPGGNLGDPGLGFSTEQLSSTEYAVCSSVQSPESSLRRLI